VCVSRNGSPRGILRTVAQGESCDLLDISRTGADIEVITADKLFGVDAATGKDWLEAH
jgi:hypothetical protein